jgi:beta-lactamase regulating signal transducer with metallopeptidase domain/ketosteroid isomerase-like protein
MTGGWLAHALAEGAVRGSVILLAAAGASLILRRSSAAMRHLAWTAGIAGALLAVPLAQLLPRWPLAVSGPLAPLAAWSPTPRVPDPHGVTVPEASPAPSVPMGTSLPEAEPAPSAVNWFALAWLLGAAALAVSFLTAAIRLLRILQTAAPVKSAAVERLTRAVAGDLGIPRERFRLRSTTCELTPMTWGFWRPTVLLPAACLEWEEERLCPVLIHEIAHISRGDVVTQALASLACVVYWFNPLVWWAAREMLIERERACDDRVLRSGSKASTYAQELLEMARSLGARWTAARVSPAMARRSQISERLLAVLDPALPRHGATRASLFAVTIGALVVLAPLAAVVPVRAKAVESLPAAFAAQPPSAQAELDLEEARAGVTAAQEAIRAAIRRGDAVRASALYCQDAVSVVPGVIPLRGRRAIQDGLEHLLGQGMADLEVYRAELLPVGDKVFESGLATLRSSDGTAATMHFMTLWKRENGEWRIFRDYATP